VSSSATRRARSPAGRRARIALASGTRTASAATPCESMTRNSEFLHDTIQAGDLSSSWLLCWVGVGS
jgi:hypothetical protein